MTIDQVIELSFLLFITALLITIGVQHMHNNSLTHEVTDYQAQIDQLHADAIRANQKAQQSAIIADRAVAAANMNSSRLMKQKVSHECSKAIAWAAEQAPRL